MTELSGRPVTLEEIESRLEAIAPLGRSEAPAWAQNELNFGQLRLLFLLDRSGPISIGGFAASIGVTPATASELLGRLERRGLVRRLHRTDDRRVVNCELSEQGAQLVAQVSGARRQALRRILSVLTPAELGQLGRLLSSISERLDAAPPNPVTTQGEVELNQDRTSAEQAQRNKGGFR